jgi:hypothetical protein
MLSKLASVTLGMAPDLRNGVDPNAHADTQEPPTAVNALPMPRVSGFLRLSEYVAMAPETIPRAEGIANAIAERTSPQRSATPRGASIANATKEIT